MVEAVEQEGLQAVPESQGEVVHGVELGNLVATVVEDIRVTSRTLGLLWSEWGLSAWDWRLS